MPEEVRVLIKQSKPFVKRGVSPALSFEDVSAQSELLNIPGFSLDEHYGSVRIGFQRKAGVSPALGFQSIPDSSYILRGKAENQKALEALIKTVEQDSHEIKVFSDPPITVFSSDFNSPIGTHHDVARLLNTPKLHKQGMNGSGVFVAIVDTGFNLAHLNRQGKKYNFSQEQSYAVGGLIAGHVPVQPVICHGTMSAFNVCQVAPECTLIDHAVIPENMKGKPLLKGFISDVFQAYSLLIDWLMEFEETEKEKPSLVINNSWGICHPNWDYLLGDSRRYIDNPNHDFNRLVKELEDMGVDILFAAGNCGTEQQGESCCKDKIGAKTIYGANSHPNVLCVSGVAVDKQHLGYSSQGPGSLEQKKPDVCAYAHFSGSGVNESNIDSGTSTACAVASGVVAAIRSVYSPSQLPPEQLRELLCETAEKLGDNHFDHQYGYGLSELPQLNHRL